MNSFEFYSPRASKTLSQKEHPLQRRRSLLDDFLRTASNDPAVLRRGLDTDKLEKMLIAKKHDWAKKRHAQRNDVLFSRFHKDIIYVPLAAIEKAPDGELRPELRLIKNFIPFLRKQIALIAGEAGVARTLLPAENVIIGIGDRRLFLPAAITGGFHSDLREQGYKLIDGIAQQNLRFGTKERPEYRALDLMRALTHDAIHAAQYKVFGTLEQKISAQKQKLKDLDPASPNYARQANQIGYAINDLEAKQRELDFDLLQYGSTLVYADRHLVIDDKRTWFPIGTALFEYTTDLMARRAITEYMKNQGIILPTPQTPLEELTAKDVSGKAISLQEVADLKGREASIGRRMVDYGQEIIRPTELILSKFGSLRPRIEEAIVEGSLSGKFRKMKAMGEELQKSNWQLTDGTQLDVARLRFFALHAVVLRPLFPGTDWLNFADAEKIRKLKDRNKFGMPPPIAKLTVSYK